MQRKKKTAIFFVGLAHYKTYVHFGAYLIAYIV